MAFSGLITNSSFSALAAPLTICWVAKQQQEALTPLNGVLRLSRLPAESASG